MKFFVLPTLVFFGFFLSNTKFPFILLFHFVALIEDHWKTQTVRHQAASASS